MKYWYWVQLVALVVVVVFAVVLVGRNLALESSGNPDWLDPIPPGMVGGFVLPGFALSLLVGQIVMWSRQSATTSASERRLIVIELLIAAVVIGFGFAPGVWELMGVLIVAILALIGFAIATTAAIIRTTLRVTRGGTA